MQTDSRPYGELFTLASTLRKSCSCGKVNDTLASTKPPWAELLVCSFWRREVKHSFSKLRPHTKVKETNGTFKMKPGDD